MSPNETSAEETGSLLTNAAAEDGQQDTAETEETTTEEPQGAPESYDFKLPDGMTNDGPLLTKFTELAKTQGMPKENAQQLVDLYLEARGQIEADAKQAWQDTMKSWAEQTKADKEIGGKQLAETMETCGRFLKDMQMGDEFYQFMDQYGLGNHPAFVKGIYKIALKTKEDTAVMSNASGSPNAAARIDNLYK